MRPTQLRQLPVYHLETNEPPAHYLHVIDVVSIEYAKTFRLDQLYHAMVTMKAKRAIRTAESMQAFWVPRGGVDSFSFMDERRGPDPGDGLLVHNDGSHFYARPHTGTGG